MKSNPYRGVGWIVLATLALGALSGCAVSGPPGQSSLFPPAPPSPPPPPPSPIIDFRAGHVRVECRSATITAGVPIRTPEARNTCDPTFVVEFSVETNPDNAMVLDLLDLYVIADWRVHRTPEHVRHDLKVHWSPARTGWTKPMTAQACPEGNVGPVLACSGSSCTLYPDVGAVPPLQPPPGCTG